MDLVFCGTPEFARPTLDALLAAGHRIRLVVSQPDRPRGRGQQLAAAAIKLRALELGLALAQPEKIKDNAEFRAQLQALAPRALVVVAYGRILPPWMLALAPLGGVNLHASLLPKYRGAAPIQWAIANGETVTGVTTMRMEEGLDTGPLLLQRELEIESQETALQLAPRLAALGAALMVETLRRLEAGSLAPRPQEHDQASLAPRLQKQDGLMDFRQPAPVLLNRLRGFQPWPGAYTSFRGKQLRVVNARLLAAAPRAEEIGQLVVEGRDLVVGCGQGSALALAELQLEGKARMTAAEFINGYRPRPGECLGSTG